MPVKIITDSVADLPPQVVKELGITVIPILIRFGTDIYRDGVDLTADEFYYKLARSKAFPVTSVPSPGTFAEIYDKLAEETDEILAIILSSRLSGTYEVALQSIGLMKGKCRVEVIDSQWATMAQGFIVMAAAKAAEAGARLDEVAAIARRTIPCVVYDFATSFSHIKEMAVEDTATPDEAEALVERLSSKFPKERIYRSKMTPAIGTHTGPHLLLVAVQEDRG